MKYLTQYDDWGIVKTAKQIFNTEGHFIEKNSLRGWRGDDNFWVFFNQYLPVPYKENKSSLIRHKEEIIKLLNGSYKPNTIWIKKGNQFKCVDINYEIVMKIKAGLIDLPTYEEIEEEKKRWQSHPEYRKKEGFSNPIKEEFVQLIFHRKGGDKLVKEKI